MRITMAAAILGASAVTVAAAPPSVGDKIVAFCKEHRGEKVGDGQCAALAWRALEVVGGKPRGADSPRPGDYVWGKLIYTIERDEKKLKTEGRIRDVRPGDIIQFSDARLISNNGYYHSSAYYPHHTAVVMKVESSGKTVRIYQQNTNGRQFVVEDKLNLPTLKTGWMRFYRPLPATTDKAPTDKVTADK